MLKLNYKLLALLIIIIISGCVNDPSQPVYEPSPIGTSGAYILCEGIWHYDNSLLSRFDFESNSLNFDYFAYANPGQNLGDLANGMEHHKEHLYIICTSAGYLEKIALNSGKSVGRLFFPKGSEPRKIAFLNDSTAYVTLLKSYGICEINPRDMKINIEKIECGPAPEHLAVYQDYVFVANSGYGDYLYHLPKAGTISVINTNSKKEVRLLECGANPIEVKVNQKLNKLYAVYYNLPSRKDTTGGIVEYDLNTLKETRRLICEAKSFCFSLTMDTAFFIGKNGIEVLDLKAVQLHSELYIPNPNLEEKWYSMAVSPRNEIWLGNAMTYNTEGFLQIYSNIKNSEMKSKIQVGVNPNTFIFF